MKKYVAIILLIGIVLASVLVTNTVKVQEKAYKTFNDSGYVLQSKDDNQNQVERYYFSGDQKYKQNYKKEITFEDTNGTKVSTNNNNFIHYTDGSISAFKNGVLVDITTIDNDPIFYYNVSANQILTKKGDSYTIKNLDKYLTFNYLLWKIDDNKYLVAGKDLRLTFEDGTEKIINGFLEIEYCDNEVVKIYNQEIMYQTISEETILHIPENIKINLVTKIVSKDDENQMSLDTMAIDSEDNIPIVDLSEEEKKDENEVNTENVVEDQNTNNNNNSNNNNNEENNQTENNEENQTNSEQNSSTTISQDGGEKTVDENPDTIQTPKFKLSNLEVTMNSLKASIEITDENGLLQEDTTVRIVRVASGKVDYENTYSLGEYQIDVDTSKEEKNLLPDTEYILQVESAYQVDSISYQKNFIYKHFKTNALGISLVKDAFTNRSMRFKVRFEPNSLIKETNVKLFLGEETKEMTLYNIKNPDMELGGEVEVEFSGLSSNTKYRVQLTDIIYDNTSYKNSEIMNIEQYYTTLKDNPRVGKLDYEINKKDSNFLLKIVNVTDKDNSIVGYRYNIYEVNKDNSHSLAKTVETDSTELTLPVDGEEIKRYKINDPHIYNFTVTVIYNDNEKICEYDTNMYSDVMRMDGKTFPTVSIVESQTVLHHESIKTLIKISDPEGAVDLDTVHVNGKSRLSENYIFTGTSNGTTDIYVDVNGLRSQETYTFEVIATVNLGLDNGNNESMGETGEGSYIIENCLIGTVSLTTPEPEPMKLTSSKLSNPDFTDPFNTLIQLKPIEGRDSEYSAKTLASLTIQVYKCKKADLVEGEPFVEIEKKGENGQIYKSKLKEEFYDKQFLLTHKLFGLELADFDQEYYTVVIKKAMDYVGNIIEIEDSVFEFRANGVVPDTILDPANAFNIRPIYNYEEPQQDKNISPNSIIGYDVQVSQTVQDLLRKNRCEIKQVTYKAINVNLKVNEDGTIEKTNGDGNCVVATYILPSAKYPQRFDVKNGTFYDKVDGTDSGLYRGNQYAFTYYIELDLNNDGISSDSERYPKKVIDEAGKFVLQSRTESAKKQEVQMKLYPSSSTENSRTYKYTLIDVDNSLLDKSLYYTVNKSNELNKSKNELVNTETFQTVTLENLTNCKLTLKLKQALRKYTPDETESVTEDEKNNVKILTEEMFETGNISSVQKTMFEIKDVDPNNIVVELKEPSDAVTAYRITLTPEDNSTAPYISDFLEMDSEKRIKIQHIKIPELMGKNLKVTVKAYYDTGFVGYDLAETNSYVTLQKSEVDSSIKYYYTLNENGEFTKLTSAQGSIYVLNNKEVNAPHKLFVENLINNRKFEYSEENNVLTYSEKGMLYGTEIMLMKKVNELELQRTGELETAKFTFITPTIENMDEQKKDYEASIRTLTLKNPKVTNPGNANIIDDSVYIEFYYGDEYGRITDSNSFETSKFSLSDFTGEKTIEIGKDMKTSLQPSKHYCMKLYVEVEKEEGKKEKIYLYDINFKMQERTYHFETTGDVGLKNLKMIYAQEESNYNNKKIKISYELEKTEGIDKIEYILYQHDSETDEYDETKPYDKIDEKLKNLVDTSDFKSEMAKELIIEPGDSFEFGYTYSLKVIPYVKTNNDEYIPLNDAICKANISLEQVNKASIVLSVNEDNKEEEKERNLTWKVTINDPSHTCVDDSYTVVVKKNENGKEETIKTINKETGEDVLNVKQSILDGDTGKIKLGREFFTTEKTFNSSYTIEVSVDVDSKNEGKDGENVKQILNTKIVPAINNLGVNLGNVTAEYDYFSYEGIIVSFTETYNLSAIKKLEYSLYNLNGYSIYGEMEFVPEKIEGKDNDFYIYIDGIELKDAGDYTMQLNFSNEKGDYDITLRVPYIG